MGTYYIKKHYRTGEEYPAPEGIHFTDRALRVAERFAAADGFLLYEAGSAERTGLAGCKCVYGYGVVEEGPLRAERIREVNGKQYPYLVRIQIVKRLQDRSRGIPLSILREQYGVQMRPTLGGIVEISAGAFEEMKEQLDALCREERKDCHDSQRTAGTVD